MPPAASRNDHPTDPGLSGRERETVFPSGTGLGPWLEDGCEPGAPPDPHRRRPGEDVPQPRRREPPPPLYLLDPVGYGDRLHGTSVTLPRAAERLPRTANLLHRDPTPVRSLESLSEEVQPDLVLRFDLGSGVPEERPKKLRRKNAIPHRVVLATRSELRGGAKSPYRRPPRRVPAASIGRRNPNRPPPPRCPNGGKPDPGGPMLGPRSRRHERPRERVSYPGSGPVVIGSFPKGPTVAAQSPGLEPRARSRSGRGDSGAGCTPLPPISLGPLGTPERAVRLPPSSGPAHPPSFSSSEGSSSTTPTWSTRSFRGGADRNSPNCA